MATLDGASVAGDARGSLVSPSRTAQRAMAAELKVAIRAMPTVHVKRSMVRNTKK